MFRFLTLLFATVALTTTANETCEVTTLPKIYPQNNCVSFNVGPGTGCAWMCTYCAGALGTNSYYFTDGVCTYQAGGCIGNPQAGVTYTCCAL
jgi:hypothetical protein